MEGSYDQASNKVILNFDIPGIPSSICGENGELSPLLDSALVSPSKEIQIELKNEATIQNEFSINEDLITLIPASININTNKYKITIYGKCLVDVYASAFLPPWTEKGRYQILVLSMI